MESRKKKKVEHERPEWGGGLAQMKARRGSGSERRQPRARAPHARPPVAGP